MNPAKKCGSSLVVISLITEKLKPISSEKLLQPSAASNEALFRPRVAPGFGHDSMSTDRSTTFAEHVDPGDQLQLHVHVDLGSRLLADDTLGTDTCMKTKRVFLVAPTANTRLRDVVSAAGFTISHFFRQVDHGELVVQRVVLTPRHSGGS